MWRVTLFIDKKNLLEDQSEKHNKTFPNTVSITKNLSEFFLPKTWVEGEFFKSYQLYL